MSTKISDVWEEDVITCGVCHTNFNPDEITTDDYNFAWDNYVHTDCCSECSPKVLVKGGGLA